ncbi:acyltransferase family protein [Hymenobacter sp. HMF4947]|uniref:Acyltransferase family protein n=1 Tax=Hymenobacter ginkgonis TaxID=2682976 RepID=A0A7K1TEL0_9BACT|nr:acyltransferase [Hymenobacter ginkgonis]MVN76838.1 acyltransferase family protein [Hymenobacter ginkgonis]
MDTPSITTLSQPDSHQNNLNFMRLFFALSVMVTHSYPLSGVREYDILMQLTNGQASLSHTAVQGFLIISGYLITKSLIRSNGLADYYTKRILRIFPGLIAVVILTAIICFFFSGKSVAAYFTHYSVRDYVVFNSLLKTQLYIDRVFTQVPYGNVVNGSLWTIPYEFLFYVLLSLCYFIRTKTRLLLYLFSIAFIASAGLWLTVEPTLQKYILPFWQLKGQHIAELGAFFLSGAIWAVLPIPMPPVATRKKLALAAVLAIALSFYFGVYNCLQFLALPILVICFGTINTPALAWARLGGDYSYGIYLWGFFVQQTLVYLFHFALMPLMFISIPITYVCGALSWNLVEERALRYKARRKAQPATVAVAS